jgi:hypothetical protein
MHYFLKFIPGMKLWPVSDSSSVHYKAFFTVHTAMVYVIQTAFEQQQQQDQDGTAVISWSCCYSKAVYKPVWQIPLLSVQCITADGGQRNCLKNVEFHSNNKFEKLVHLVRFIIRKSILKLLTILIIFRFIKVANQRKFWKYIHCTHIIEFKHSSLQRAYLKAGNNYKDY